MDTWTVVEFTEDSSVEAVPTKWIINENNSFTCYWPPFSRDKLVQEIKNNTAASSQWPVYKIRIFKDATYDSYQMARRKSRRAEDTSDLNSDVDVVKRKIRPPRISSSDSEIEAPEKTHLPKPPKLSLGGTRLENPKQTGDNNYQLTPSLSQTISYLHSSATSQCNMDTPSNAGSTTTRNVECNCCPVHQKKLEEFMSAVLKKQSIMRVQLQQLSEDIHSKMSLQKTDQIDLSGSLFSKFKFLLNSQDELEGALNDYLNDEEQFKAAVSELVKIGGSNNYEFTRRCLSQMLTNELATKYTFFGSATKNKLSQFKIWDLLKESAYAINPDIRQNVIEKDVQKWLRRANERLKYEKK